MLINIFICVVDVLMLFLQCVSMLYITDLFLYSFRGQFLYFFNQRYQYISFPLLCDVGSCIIFLIPLPLQLVVFPIFQQLVIWDVLSTSFEIVSCLDRCFCFCKIIILLYYLYFISLFYVIYISLLICFIAINSLLVDIR